MHPQIVISSIILLLTDAVVSYKQVSGVVGQPVTLPCKYSGELTTTCWGRGTCPSSQCSDEIIKTDGSQVTFRKQERYNLKGSLVNRDVSLTIENAVEADSGLYCCRIEHRGWFNDLKVTLSLEIKAVVTSPSPTWPAETQPKIPQETKSQSTPWHSCLTDGNGMVTQSSDGLWHENQTEIFLIHETHTTSAEKIYIGSGIFVALILSFLIALIIKRQLYKRNKLQHSSVVSFNGPQIGALQSATEERARAQDNVYIIEENFYVVE